MRPQSTVYDRAQQNGGYMTGPDHMYEQQPRAVDEGVAGTEESPAPNYREAESAEMACKNCAHFDDETMHCQQYDFQAKPYMVCDDWASREQGETPGMENSEVMPS